MLNRRILRSKALQLAYGFYSSRKANFQMAQDTIKMHYSVDLNSIEVQDKKALKVQELEAKNLFAHGDFKSGGKEMKEVLVEADNYYKELNRKDLISYKKQLLQHAENIFTLYLKGVLLLVKLADCVNKEAIDLARNRPAAPKSDENQMKFYHNSVVDLIRNSKEFQKTCESNSANWGDEQDFVDTLYKDGLKKNEFYKKYVEQDISKIRFEDEIEIVQKIFSEVILNHPVAIAEFESIDISWFQNKAIVRSMIKFTLKSIEEDNASFPFAPLAKNWEEDKSFYEKLFNLTVANDAEYEELIASRTQNWDTERISLMDKIILKLALCEMENFPSIPVKVTINEFIDLSKQFSTPKSKIFVNGLLDKMADELVKKGKIKKSGRGLIDNK